jgi:hypothetical protein
MERQTERLVVRQHSRYQCDQPARLTIDAPHAEQVVFSKAAVDARGMVVARVVDCSQGGLGIQCCVFVPKGALILVRVLPEGATGDSPAAVEVRVRVQRVAMTDRAPTYYLGAAFVSVDQPTRDRLERTLAASRGAAAPGPTAAKGGGDA